MSQSIIKLDHPIKVNNEEVSTLTYDFTEITNDLYLEACMRSSRVGSQMNTSVLKETNEALLLCFGKAAVIAVNPQIAWEDLNRLKGRDLLRVSNVGRFFITGRSEDSQQKASGKQSEDTASGSTQV